MKERGHEVICPYCKSKDDIVVLKRYKTELSIQEGVTFQPRDYVEFTHTGCTKMGLMVGWTHGYEPQGCSCGFEDGAHEPDCEEHAASRNNS